ncbi:MAG: hypothetical protein AAFY00_10315, partial [Bacteroidota bacterium]
MNKKLVFILLFILGFQLNAQNYKFRKVSKEELSEETYAKDSTASAAYLYNNRNSFYRYTKGDGFT